MDGSDVVWGAICLLGFVWGWTSGATYGVKMTVRKMAAALAEGRSPAARAMRAALDLSAEHDR